MRLARHPDHAAGNRSDAAGGVRRICHDQFRELCEGNLDASYPYQVRLRCKLGGRRLEPSGGPLFCRSRAECCQCARSTMRRTARLLVPSMPVSSSTFPALPPQPRDASDREYRGSAERASLNSRSWPHRSQVMRRNHDGNAANGSSRASAGRCRMTASGAARPGARSSGRRSYR
jgi:hypothetical protein